MVVSGQTAGFPRCIISDIGSRFFTVTYIQVYFAAAVAEVEILSVRFVAPAVTRASAAAVSRGEV